MKRLANAKRKGPSRSQTLGWWWAHLDSNQGPKDYAYHFGFRRPFRVRGLDYTFPLQAGRLVSTPSPRKGLGSVSAYRRFDLAFTEFDQFYRPPE